MYSCTRDLFLGTGTNGTLLLDPAGDLLNLFAICPHKWQDTPANGHSNLSVSDLMQGNKLPACTFFSFSPPTPLFFI